MAQQPDSLLISKQPYGDSLLFSKTDTISLNDTMAIPMADSEIKDIINYQAEDSIVYDLETQKMYLYNKASLKYEQIKLDANAIDFDWKTSEMLATGTKNDSTQEIEGTPEFEDNGKTYQATKMTYNFKTQKGKVYEVMTQEGDAYLHSEIVKKHENNEWFGYKTKFTTCELEHPHFYFKAKKVKMIPNKVMVTGPANLWIGDMPTPLYVPFGIFPVKQGKRSGIIPPQLGGFSNVTALGLTNFGYYWAINDHFDWKNIASVYTNGTVNFLTTFRASYLYKFQSTLNFGYSYNPPADPDLPNQSGQHNFKIGVNMTLDPKVAPTNSFNANINVATAKYNRSLLTNNITTITNTSFNSYINYQKTFNKVPWLNLNLSATHNQNIVTRDFSIQLPVFGINVNRVTPFKNKYNTGKPKWHENIGIAYNFEAKYQLNTYDSLLSNPYVWRRYGNFGMRNNIVINAPVTVFKYFNINPSFSYTERWYFQTIKKTFIQRDGIIQLPGMPPIVIPGAASYTRIDTLDKFAAARDFRADVTINTKVVGIFKFKTNWLKSVRHVFTPAVTATFQPDFGKPFWGYYDSVRTNLADNSKVVYSKFEKVAGLYGAPGSGMVGAIRISLGNTFDMKTFSRKDTAKKENISPFFLERISISAGYNFAATTNKVEIITIGGSLRFLENLRGSFNLSFDPYALDSIGNRTNTFQYSINKHLTRLSAANFSIEGSLRGKAKNTENNTEGNQGFKKGDYVSFDPNAPYDFSIPWDVNLKYNINITPTKSIATGNDTTTINQTLFYGGNVSLTPHWKLGIVSGFDVQQKKATLTQITVARNLHCWKLAISWTAYPLNYQSFTIELSPVSGLIQDIKVPIKRQATLINQPF